MIVGNPPGSPRAVAGAVGGYTSGMKTAISLPADLHRRADRFARRTHRSRSRLYAEALEQYLLRHDADEISEALNAVYAGEHEPDNGLSRAAAATLARSEW